MAHIPAPPPAGPRRLFRLIALGAGVQSSKLYLSAARGDYGVTPDAAVFADTGWEPRYVYEWLDRLEAEAGFVIPIYRVSAGDLRASIYHSRAGKRFASIPAFVDTPGGGMLRRQCTREFKVEPITRLLRRWCYQLLLLERGYPETWVKVLADRLLYILPNKPATGSDPFRHLRRLRRELLAELCAQPLVEQWFGISVDELIRMRSPRHPWIVNRYPLVEGGESRADCAAWLEANGFPRPRKSACCGCPYRSDAEWRALRTDDPAGWTSAVEFDHALRDGRLLRSDFPNYLHRSRLPLDQVDLATQEERGQERLDLDLDAAPAARGGHGAVLAWLVANALGRGALPSAAGPDFHQDDLFGEECEGLCGV